MTHTPEVRTHHSPVRQKRKQVYAVKRSKLAIIVAGALVAGLTLGGLGIADAAVRNAHKTVASKSASVAKGVSPVATLSRMTKLSVKRIMALRHQGKSFASIAASMGVDPAAVVDQMVAARQAHLDAMVAAGRMTAAQEQAMLAVMRTTVGTMMGLVPGSGSGMMSGDTTQSATGMPGNGYGGGNAGTGMTPGQGNVPTMMNAPAPTDPGTAPAATPAPASTPAPRTGMMGSGSTNGSGMMGSTRP